MSLVICYSTMYMWTLNSLFLFFSKLRFWPKIFRCCVLRWGRCPRHDQPSEQLRPTLFHFAPPPPLPPTQLTRFTNNCNLSHPPPTTFGVCGIFRPLYLPSSYLLCTNLIQPDWAWEKQIKPGRFYPDLTLWLDHHQEVLSSTSLTPLFSNLWLIFREAWWDEPDHELVIGYNCPRSHCTDFTKSFSPATGASLPRMGTEAKPEQSQGSKLASQATERRPKGQKAKARPPDLSWCGLQFVGRTPWQTEGDGSATLPTAAAAPTRTWVHTGR